MAAFLLVSHGVLIFKLTHLQRCEDDRDAAEGHGIALDGRVRRLATEIAFRFTTVVTERQRESLDERGGRWKARARLCKR